MITNEKIWMAIDRIAGERGLTCGGLARAAELDQTIFNPSKRIVRGGRKRWPSSETIAKVLNVTGQSMTEFGRLVDGIAGPAPNGARRRARRTASRPG